MAECADDSCARPENLESISLFAIRGYETFSGHVDSDWVYGKNEKNKTTRAYASVVTERVCLSGSSIT